MVIGLAGEVVGLAELVVVVVVVVCTDGFPIVVKIFPLRNANGGFVERKRLLKWFCYPWVRK